MSDLQSSRRRQAQEDLGLKEDVRQVQQMERAMQKEEERRSAKEDKKRELERLSSPSRRVTCI